MRTYLFSVVGQKTASSCPSPTPRRRRSLGAKITSQQCLREDISLLVTFRRASARIQTLTGQRRSLLSSLTRFPGCRYLVAPASYLLYGSASPRSTFLDGGVAIWLPQRVLYQRSPENPSDSSARGLLLLLIQFRENLGKGERTTGFTLISKIIRH